MNLESQIPALKSRLETVHTTVARATLKPEDYQEDSRPFLTPAHQGKTLVYMELQS